MNRKKLIIWGVVAVACMAVFLKLATKGVKAGTQQENLSLQPVAVTLVKRAPLVNSITLSGAFRPYQEVDVHAKVAGYIRQIFVDVGDKVKAGQVLAILEVPELNAQVLGAKADLQRCQDAIHRAASEVQRVESSHAAYHSAYTRLNQASMSRPGLIAQQELDDSSAKDAESEAQVESARAASAESKSQFSYAQANLTRLSALESYSHITAPFAGVVTKRFADTGALIQAGTASDTQSLPVVRLAEWTKLRLVVPVPESAVPEIHLGSIVKVRVPSIGRSFQGTVARFATALNQQTRTMDTEIDVENHDGGLVNGMYAETDLVLKQLDNVLTVPVQTVDRNGPNTSVVVIGRDGVVRRKQVQLGDEGSDLVEIKSGLEEDDQVVLGNRGGLVSGEKVEPRVVDAPSSTTKAAL